MNRSPAVGVLIGWVVALATATPINAQNTRHIESQIKQTRERDANPTDSAQLAKQWGLNTEEWTRYEELMRGPLGTQSPGLDPLTALGIEAQSDALRRRYAELQVRVEAMRVEKLLAFQRAYDEAWKKLYPSLKPITARQQREQPRAATGTSSSGRAAVFVKDHCPTCDAKVRELQVAGRSFDIYMIGTRQNDEQIRRWAARVALDPAKVRSRTITLNHDAGRWLSLRVGGELPAVLRDVEGQWQRE